MHFAPQFIWVEMRCRRLDRANSESGELEVVAVMRDVTERKLQEEALDRARVEARNRISRSGIFRRIRVPRSW